MINDKEILTQIEAINNRISGGASTKGSWVQITENKVYRKKIPAHGIVVNVLIKKDSTVLIEIHGENDFYNSCQKKVHNLSYVLFSADDYTRDQLKTYYEYQRNFDTD